MAVYNIGGINLNDIAYSYSGELLFEAYDINGAELFDNAEIIINPDSSTGESSGYVLTSVETGNQYVLRLVADWGTTDFQSCIMNTDTNMFNRMNTTATVTVLTENMSEMSTIILSSTAGHKNDAAYHNGSMFMLDGTANNPKDLYIWDTSGVSVRKETLPINDNTNGSLTVVAGVTQSSENTYLYLISRDKYESSDIDHQTGDAMNIYRYKITDGTVEWLASFPWDCVYIQGATFYNGVLYVVCNSPTTGSASNYTGITVKCIRMDTYQLFDTLTVSGNFEPEGMDTVHFSNHGTEFTFGIAKYNAISKFVRFTIPYELRVA